MEREPETMPPNRINQITSRGHYNGRARMRAEKLNPATKQTSNDEGYGIGLCQLFERMVRYSYNKTTAQGTDSYFSELFARMQT
jgi:hypothetical protein